MKAIILAAGRGSRMGQSTQDKPKCLTNIFGRSLLEQQISKLKEAGIQTIGVVRGYMSEKINLDGIEYFENSRWNESNMVQSLCCAERWLSEGDCIISYSDILYQTKAIYLLKDCSEKIAITYSTNWLELWEARFENPLNDAETFELDQDSYVKEIGGMADTKNQIEGQYMGLLKITADGWNEVKRYLDTLDRTTTDHMDMTALLSQIIKRGVKVFGIPYNGLWLEVDNEKDLRLYEKKYDGI